MNESAIESNKMNKVDRRKCRKRGRQKKERKNE
jgi:hypothetical protein